ncbi:MAG: pirin family protein [Alphaproteobacteria bacterium]
MNMIDLIIAPRDKDLGGFSVHRILPFVKRRMVGPFIFLDHIGPSHFDAGQGIDVRPHPHIGLATVTYLFSGEILHRDSLGSDQLIAPGDVNWMTAGRGIAHSERTPKDERKHPHPLHGLQSWVALPKEHEDCAPEFFHHPATTLPIDQSKGVHLRVIAGEAYGLRAPVKTYSPLFYVEAHMQAGSRLELPAAYPERAVYVVDGQITINGTAIEKMTMPVLLPGGNVIIDAHAPSHLMLLGGEPFAEPRYIDWNFVSSDPDRIVAAKQAWRDQTFAKIPGDDQEFVPLP